MESLGERFVRIAVGIVMRYLQDALVGYAHQIVFPGFEDSRASRIRCGFASRSESGSDLIELIEYVPVNPRIKVF